MRSDTGTLWVLGLVVSACASSRPTPAEVPPHAPPRAAPVNAPLPAPNPLETSPHVALGVPLDSDPRDDYWMDKGAYVLSYDDARHEPHWVAWRLERSDLGDVDRSNDFRPDPDLPSGFLRIGQNDYAHSGYDRGHMCPSAHRTASREANSLTFLMTNMQPQLHASNAGVWKGLETWERERAAEGKVVYVVAGGIFGASPELIGPGVAVPEANFRVTVVLEPGQTATNVTPETPVFGAIVPNDASVRGKKWQELVVSVDEVERRTGYDFLARLPDDVERAKESVSNAP
jgi:endonuclease G